MDFMTDREFGAFKSLTVAKCFFNYSLIKLVKIKWHIRKGDHIAMENVVTDLMCEES